MCGFEFSEVFLFLIFSIFTVEPDSHSQLVFLGFRPSPWASAEIRLAERLQKLKKLYKSETVDVYATFNPTEFKSFR